MKDSEIITEQERGIYCNPFEGFQSAERPYQKAKEKGLSVSRKMVREWLKTQDTYTRYKPIIRKHKYRKTFVKNLADQMQMDLVDMGNYGSKNKGYRWILTAIEILSRFAFTMPVYRKDIKNMTKAVDLLLENFKRRFGKYYKKDDTYRIEKVLKKKNGMALVKWLGYDSRWWIPIEDIKDIE